MGFATHLRLVQKKAPPGIDTDSWRAYRCTVSLVGIQHARKPYPENPYWHKVAKRRPRGRSPRGKIWDELEGWVSRVSVNDTNETDAIRELEDTGYVLDPLEIAQAQTSQMLYDATATSS